MKKVKSMSETFRENPWKLATIVLAGVGVLLFINMIYEINQDNKKIEKEICNTIVATPAWVDSKGTIINYGIVNLAGNQSSKLHSDILTEYLIKDRIRFVYNPSCSACQTQIQIFGDENFNKLKQVGLTLDCSKNG